MRIRELFLESFKGFGEFTLQCSRFTCLAGPNNGGKTSLLHAIKLLFDVYRFALGNKSQPDFSNIRWESSPEESIRRLSFGDPDAIWLKKRTTEPCRISALLEDQTKLSLEIQGPSKYSLDIMLDGTSIRGKPVETRWQERLHAVFRLNPAFVPPVGSVSPAERFLSHPQFVQSADQGKSSECWRSQLFWLYNDGKSEEFEGVLARVSRYLPGVNIMPPGLTHGNPPDVLVQYSEDDVVFDISTSGGGLRTLLNLAVVLQFADSTCLLLDEPDAHLHGTLQRAVSSMLSDYCDETDVQVIVASHAPDFLSEIPIESLRWIDRRDKNAQSCEGLGALLTDLGAVSKADAIRAYGADKVLFVEGCLDQSVLGPLFQKSGYKNPFDDPHVIVARLPGGKGDRTHLRMFKQLLNETLRIDVAVAAITDHDFEFDSGPESTSDVCVLTLERKEVENFLLEPQVLHCALVSLAKKREEFTGKSVELPSQEDVLKKLNDILGSDEIRNAVRFQMLPQYRATLDSKLDPSTKEERGEEWWSKHWEVGEFRMKRCPGKRVLAELRKWCQTEFGVTLTSGELIRSISHCPEEVSRVAKRIEQHLYGT